MKKMIIKERLGKNIRAEDFAYPSRLFASQSEKLDTDYFNDGIVFIGISALVLCGIMLLVSIADFSHSFS